MGTRGIIGVRVDGADKLTYNHSDSYPEGAGQEVYQSVIDTILPNLGKYQELARALKIVKEKVPPTADEIEKLKPFANTGVSSGEVTEWYVLLRNLQGDLVKTIEAGYMLGSKGFEFDSLFCEWGYVVNLDDLVFETYQGFQTTKHKKGRYGLAYPKWAKAHPPERGEKRDYHAIALVHSQQITPKMPSKEQWLKKINELTAEKEA